MLSNLHAEQQRQILRTKYTSRKFHTKWYQIVKEYIKEFSERIKSLDYDIRSEQVDSFDTYYFIRCRCNEKHATKKPSNVKKRGKPVLFPRKSNNIGYKTFIIKYEKQLPPVIVLMLNTFNHKYFYYAIDDILNLLKSNPVEQNNILSVLYLPAILLHNNFSISFFHMWIREIYIEKIIKSNKFLFKDFKTINYITIKFMYKIAKPIKKTKSIW